MHRYPHGYDGKVEEVRLQSQQLRLQLQVPWPAFFGVRSRCYICVTHGVTYDVCEYLCEYVCEYV